MKHLAHTGDSLASAIHAGVPPAIAALVVSTNHSGKLSSLFMTVSARFLEAFRRSHAMPKARTRRLEVVRLKALVDLIRARQKLTGERRPTTNQCIEMLDAQKATSAGNVIALRKAA